MAFRNYSCDRLSYLEPVSIAMYSRAVNHAEYFLTSPRLGFRCWSAKDFPLASELWGDFRVTQFIGGPFSEQQIRERLEREIAGMRDYSIQYWPIFLLSNGQHAGCAGLRPHETEQKTYELGFHLRFEFWRQGFAEEAARAVIAYGFDQLGANALFAGHHPENNVSHHLLEKPVSTSSEPSFILPLDCSTLLICCGFLPLLNFEHELHRALASAASRLVP